MYAAQSVYPVGMIRKYLFNGLKKYVKLSTVFHKYANIHNYTLIFLSSFYGYQRFATTQKKIYF